MYKLTEKDKFNIKNLLGLRRKEGISDKEFIDAIIVILNMNNFKLAGYINKLLHAWEQDWGHRKTNKEQELYDYCNKLIHRLLDDSEENNNEVKKLNIVSELDIIHPDIYSHIEKFYIKGLYSTAVEESYKITRKKLEVLTGYEKATDAFKKGYEEVIFGKNAENEAENDFFEGIKFLHFAIQRFRNEKAHTPAKELEKNRAIHYIYLASLSLYLIENKNK